MSIVIPNLPLIRSSDHACVIRSAQGSDFIYSCYDNCFYHCTDIETDLEKVEKICQQHNLHFQIDPQLIRRVLGEKVDYLLLNVTDQCNLRCKYCAYSGIFVGERQHGSLRMSNKVASLSLSYYAEHSTGTQLRKIGFYGGEPFLQYRLIQDVITRAIALFGEDNVAFSATTNGTIRHPGDVTFFAEAGISLWVSLDGSPSVHNRSRVDSNGLATWHHVMAFIEDLRDAYGGNFSKKIGLSITIANPEDLKEIHDFMVVEPLLSQMTMRVGVVDWSRCFTPSCTLIGTDRIGQSYLDKYCTQLLSSNECDRFISGIFDPLIGHIWARPAVDSDLLWPGGSCIPGGKRLFVSSDGVFYPCERVGTDFPIGDFKQGIIIDRIINYLCELVELMNEYCGTCWARRLCSVCLANSRWNGTVSRERIMGLCEGIKWQLSFLLSAYLSINELSPHIWSQRFENNITLPLSK